MYRYGKFASGKFISVHAMKRHPGTRQSGNKVDPILIRMGFCANKRELGAVGRNRVRRLMRESFRELQDILPQGYDYVFTYKSGKDIPKLSDISNDMVKCCKRLRLMP
ncbi:MAG: ribonuclease P protein component [Clostridiales bacterium]|nr:ribonuclease P protein component [Clostridiales bacterium]